MKQLSIPNLSEDDFLLDRLEEQIHRFEQLLEMRFHGGGDVVGENLFSDDSSSAAPRHLFAADEEERQ